MKHWVCSRLVSLSILASVPLILFAQNASANDVRSLSLSGMSSAQTGAYTPSGPGDATRAEFPGQLDGAGPGPYPGAIVNRSLSRGSGTGVSVKSGKKAKSKPQFGIGFEGLNFYQQRYARGGNQFSVEPPDQALCVGNGYVLEAVNDVLNIYDSSGGSVLPDNTATNIVNGLARNINHAVDLNSFFGYAPAIDRSTGIRGPSLTDPSCLYDVTTQRFFVVILTLDTFPNGVRTKTNHLDIAVSQTSNPTGAWNIYKIDVTNDGTNAGGVNPGPFLGDYPHIGADPNGFYVTTNAYPWSSNGFGGAQIYALSKAQLAAGAPSITMVHFDTSGMVNLPSDAGSTQPGFTVWPAQSPNVTSDFNGEYFLSSNAAVEATNPVAGSGGSHTSNTIIVWALNNTSSLNLPSPALTLTNQILSVNPYAIPPKAKQPGAGTLTTGAEPLGACINDTTTLLFDEITRGCWNLLPLGGEPAHNEVVSTPDSNDTRMQRVTYANGALWAALDTALSPDGGAQRAGIAWYIINPNSRKVAMQGYLGAAGYDLTYPALTVTASGRGVMAFTATGDSLYPSAAYASVDAIVGVGTWDVVPGGQGAAQDDGFTSYVALDGAPVWTRWGDYGAAAVDGNSIWIASEYIAHACSYVSWGGLYFAGGSGDNLPGTCADTTGANATRGGLGNWSTRISNFRP